MEFGPVKSENARDGILAHSRKVGGKTFKKGRVLNEDDVTLLRRHKVREIVIGRLEPGDVHEDQAADDLTARIRGPGTVCNTASTGRCYLFAETDGLLVLDAERLRSINHISPEVTIATLPDFTPVSKGRTLATIKIIPFAVARSLLDRVAAATAKTDGLLSVHPFAGLRVNLIQTVLPETRVSVLDKTVRVIQNRLQPLRCELGNEWRCAHDEVRLAAEITQALHDQPDLLLIIGASAIVDARDVIPSAIIRAGGEVEHVGMPVDPGNLILLAQAGTCRVLGLPGCARSPSLNGLDLLLQRLAARVPVTAEDIMAMGVGGLLK
ncbi:molybdopterin-binding protein [Methylonatrum kenyense]|uniref:molybdopterin-binding protein n=1 Tax=Methylonatrum kenyense TaxID=455253 RepID=UPI0020C10DE4|nr:molybdopterin-binding protein [Methylonatrum kenyense]MCK8517320.1 molybdopterin-binding protein [Methylonatrum kenyense]